MVGMDIERTMENLSSLERITNADTKVPLSDYENKNGRKIEKYWFKEEKKVTTGYSDRLTGSVWRSSPPPNFGDVPSKRMKFHPTSPVQSTRSSIQIDG